MSEPRKYILELPAYFKPTTRNHPAYSQWASMVSRCENPSVPKYKDYGGRGITVCKRWRRGENGMTGFECFMQDMGNKPTQKHSLDRKNNNGNYCKSNCKWSTNKEQCNNRRSNRILTYKGESMSMLMLAEKVGMSYFVLRNRVSRGWDVVSAVEFPHGARFYPMNPANGERLPQSKLTEEKVIDIRKRFTQGMTYILAREFGVSPSLICMVINRKIWKHVKEN